MGEASGKRDGRRRTSEAAVTLLTLKHIACQRVELARARQLPLRSARILRSAHTTLRRTLLVQREMKRNEEVVAQVGLKRLFRDAKERVLRVALVGLLGHHGEGRAVEAIVYHMQVTDVHLRQRASTLQKQASRALGPASASFLSTAIAKSRKSRWMKWLSSKPFRQNTCPRRSWSSSG